MSRLDDAITAAVSAHKRQVDKSGQPYILHPLRVMLAMETEEERIVAVLHDVVEDCDVPISEIRRLFGDEIAEAVDSVSRRPEEIYFDYIKRARNNQIGRKVKLADLRDNLSPERMAGLPEKERGISKRYDKAVEILTRENEDG